MTIPEIYSLFIKSTGVSTDTRNVVKGQLFVALKGVNFNGNLYATQALESGASYAIIDEGNIKLDERYVVVHDCLHTLQLLANYHRQQFDIPLLAITGTNGKTTSKELIAAVLSKKFRIKATKGNLNNHIGVPLTLLSISDKTELAIIEMGANKIGDVRELCSFANPTHGVIINVGKAHLEGFGSFEGIIQTKTELYDFIYNGDHTAFVNGNQQILKDNASRIKQVHFFQDSQQNTCELVDSRLKDEYLEVRIPSGKTIDTNLVGGYNLDNVAVAVEIGYYFGVSEKEIVEAIAGYVPTNNRSQVIKIKKGSILLDAYNANPFSMEVALQNLSSLDGRQYAILGDMFELGKYANDEHLKVIETSVSNGIQVIYCGELFFQYKQEFPLELFFETRDEVIAYLKGHKNWMNELGHLLIKGSRGMALERIIEEIDF
jgi:UDP-N-acetylmuramoyl-tripeptide--D-alanyl-D-alanine ligase